MYQSIYLVNTWYSVAGSTIEVIVYSVMYIQTLLGSLVQPWMCGVIIKFQEKSLAQSIVDRW